MKSIKFENGDMCFKHGQLSMVEDLECRIQKTRCLLKISLGELFYNTNIGMDFSKVLSIENKNLTIEDKKMAIRECLIKDENIDKIQVIDILYNDKRRTNEITLKIKYKQQSDVIEIGGIAIE